MGNGPEPAAGFSVCGAPARGVAVGEPQGEASADQRLSLRLFRVSMEAAPTGITRRGPCLLNKRFP